MTIARHLVPVVVVAVLFVGGCVSNRTAEFGRIDDIKPGEHVSDFTFRGVDGEVQTFSNVRSVVTVVAFPPSPDWPKCDQCRSIERAVSAQAGANTPVTVVSIGTPDKPCEREDCSFYQCHIEGRAKLVALHDGHGRVRKQFGPNALGKFFVIDMHGRLAASGQLEDIRSLKGSVGKAVAQHEAWWAKLYRRSQPQASDS